MTAPRPIHVALVLVSVGLLAETQAAAQWSHRYPLVKGFSHHVYLEGFELPLVTNGPIDPAPSPDGRQIAIASRGWLWLLDRESGVARQVTSDPGMDSRPAWSPDGRQLVFVRDNSKETAIVLLDVGSGAERVLVDEPAIDLDPAFAPDGKSVYWSSAVAGDPDLWRIELATGAKSRITTQAGVELQPLPLPDGKRIAYLEKGLWGDFDQVRVRSLEGGEEKVLVSGSIYSMMRLAVAPDGQLVAYTVPSSDADGWEIRLSSVDHPGPTVLLGRGHGMPLTPRWTADGQAVVFSEADKTQRMHLYQVSRQGGVAAEIPVVRWDWKAATARLRIRTHLKGLPSAAAARLTVRDGAGHPLVPDQGQPRFDGQNGIVFFYSNGTIELTVPVGTVTVGAVRGLATPLVTATASLQPGETREVDLELAPLWNAREAGWYAGDHHFHLNYGGPYRLDPTDLLPMAAGEDMDVLTPLVANLHTRFEDQSLFRFRRLDTLPFVYWGQEVRSHYLGHIGLIGMQSLFWPWIWGPGYEVYGQDDRPNRQVLDFARRQGGMATYMHPIMSPTPFEKAALGEIPVELVADAVQGNLDALEIACLWSDEIGSMEMWHRVLNLGIPMVPEAGTDVMNNFYRTMAIGTARVYAHVDGPVTFNRYLEALKQGRSFVTNGPLLDWSVDGKRPGEVLEGAGRTVTWRLQLHSSVRVDKVEVLLNGVVAFSAPGLASPGSKGYTGSLKLPTGGWVAVRAVGGATNTWPAMDSYAFAHTAPIWIGRVGSYDPVARKKAAADLLAALDAADRSLGEAYKETEIPQLRAQFAGARRVLEEAMAGK
jgi:TolB protein